MGAQGGRRFVECAQGRVIDPPKFRSPAPVDLRLPNEDASRQPHEDKEKSRAQADETVDAEPETAEASTQRDEAA